MKAAKTTHSHSAALAGCLALVACVLLAPSAGAACATTQSVRKGGGGSCTSIQQCVNAVPSTLTGDYCINVDSATYSEQVTIQGVNAAAYQIIIQSDPALISTVATVNPPSASIAAFQIRNTGVNLRNLLVVTTNTVSYGVWASSAGVTISSVNVIDTGANITTAGMAISSNSMVSYSSIAVQNAYGLKIGGSGSLVSWSTMTSNSVSYSALDLSGASSNTITQSYISNPSGYGAQLLDAGYNTISQSSILSNTSSADALSISATGPNKAGYNLITQSYVSNFAGHAGMISFGADHNDVLRSTFVSNSAIHRSLELNTVSSITVAQSYFSNPTGYALLISWSTAATISQSTMTSASGFGLFVDVSSAVTVTGSYAQGVPAVYIRNSTQTAISSCLLASFGSGKALWVAGGNAGFYASSSIVLGGASADGVLLDANNRGLLAFSSLTISGALSALSISGQAPGAILAVSSITFQSLSAGATAVNFLGGSFISTFSGINFADSSISVNVNGSGLGGGSRITMVNPSGPRAGPVFEDDPSNRVDWGAGFVTLTVGVPVNGLIESTDLSIKCGGGYTQCSASYSSGTLVALTATPDAGYSLGSWNGACGGISTNTCNVYLDYSKSASADFFTGAGGSSVTFSISPMPASGRIES
ncbi:MAG TPA: hypothetical protein DCZ01_11555, partial [Elusimicrobia bacterium]|nr:hypothetical protein [Elusimicrobiota bacterium]